MGVPISNIKLLLRKSANKEKKNLDGLNKKYEVCYIVQVFKHSFIGNNINILVNIIKFNFCMIFIAKSKVKYSDFEQIDMVLTYLYKNFTKKNLSILFAF